MVDFIQRAAGNSASTTLSSGVTNTDTSFPLTSDTAFLSGGGLIIVDEGQATEELAYYTGKSGGALTVPLANRGLEGGSAQAHASGATVKGIMSADMWNNVVETLLNGFSVADGSVDTTKLVDTSSNQTIAGNKTFTGTITGAGAATWTAFSGAYASGTTITIAGTDMTGVMKKGVVLKWLSSADAFKTGMVVSSSFSTDTTVTIVGSTAASGDKTFYYGPFANYETFIIPGTLAAGTDLAKTFYMPEASYPLSCDAYVKTAGTTNATEFDINDDGTTLFNGTAASIASAGTSDIDNTAYTAATEVAKDSLITVDVNSVSTTAPVEAYLKFYFYPKSLVSRT